MIKKIKSNIIPIILTVCLFITFFILNRGIQTSDDLIYKDAFYDVTTYWYWLKEFYCSWSGRITVSTLINIFANTPIIVFKISNTIIFGLIIYFMYRIINVLSKDLNKTIKKLLLFCIPGFIYCINIRVISSGCLWLSGALNYFWPLGCCLIALYPFICELKEIECKKRNYIIFFLANFIAAFAEQTAMVLICFGLITFFICKLEKRKLNKLLIVHYIMIVIFSMILFLAPGNAVRSEAEELLWYYDFGMLSIGDKILQSFSYFVDNIINDNFILFGALVINIFLLNIEKNKKSWLKLLLSYILLMYLLVSVSFAKYNIFNLGNISINHFYKIENVLKLILNAIIFSVIGMELMYVFENRKNGLIISILYFASICSAIVLGFSPTIFASGNRIFVLTYYFLALINSCLSVEILRQQKGIGKTIYIGLLLVISISMYVNLYSNGINTILY